MPIGFTRLMYEEDVTNTYKTEPELQMGSRKLSVPRGQCWGVPQG